MEESKRKQELKDITKGTLSDPEEKYDTPKQHLADIPGDLRGIRVNQYKTRVNLNYKRDTYTETLAKQNAKMKKWGLLKLIPAALVLIATQNPKWAMKTFSLSKNDMINVIKHSLPVMKAKKELIEALGLHKGALLKDVDINNPNEMANLDDTDFPDIMKELTDLTKKPEEEEQPDRPEQIEVVPIGEEIEEYEGTYAMSPWDRIKANQAKRAMLVEKDIIQENPIVGESVADITMEANSGGLANLFRVKNQ
jgi:hypothetical protein